MISPLHQGLLALLCARPELALLVWACVEPSAAAYIDWIARVQDNNLRIHSFDPETPDAHRLPDAVFTVHEGETLPATCALVYECQLWTDPHKIYTWLEYLAAARRKYQTRALVIVFSPVDTVIAWVRGRFVGEPNLCPLLLGRHQLPKITDVEAAIRNPEFAVFAAAFHGEHDGGEDIVKTAAHALRTLPLHKRKEYYMTLIHGLPEALMDEVRDITFDDVTDAEAAEAVDLWMRTRGPYVKGERSGLLKGREEGREQGLLEGRLEALADVLELRGLVPSEDELAKIASAKDPALVDRWRVRAKHVASVADLFAD